MEDRKRLLPDGGDDVAPGRKRLRDEHGNVMRMSDDKEKDVEDYQKDAILRQMKEFKRSRDRTEEELSQLRKKTVHHSDHLRIIDAWFAQLLDEVRVLASESLPTPPPTAASSAGEELYRSALLFDNNENFTSHLKTRSRAIKIAIADLFGRIPPESPAVEDLRRQLNEVLAQEKVHIVDCRNADEEKAKLNVRLEEATSRYLIAERKLDRAKSAQVLKLERAHTASGGHAAGVSTTGSKPGTATKKEQLDTNGDLENGVATVEAEAARKEAVAAAEQQKAQLDEIEAENDRLTNELSAARTKMASLSDDDYAETSLFKALKSQHEDTIKRINDLEATNIQLREEAQRLHSERTTYRAQVAEEHRNHTNEIEVAGARGETDLARIRNSRDQLSSDLAVAKAIEERNRSSLQAAKHIADATKERASVLESEVARLKLRLGDTEPNAMDEDSSDVEALKLKLRTLTSQHSLLSNELPSMEAAWKKASNVATKKIEDWQEMEEKVDRSAQEKTKADQKYFGAMKAKDMRDAELRTLKSQNARSSEIVSQLKDVESKTKELCGNLERQLVEAKEGLAKVELQHRHAESKLKETTLSADGLRKNNDELKSLVSTKDKENLATAKAKRDLEENLARTQAQLEDAEGRYQKLVKSRAGVNGSNADPGDHWRNIAICPVCRANIRNTVIKLCGHVFCSECIQDRITNRSRKCPSCMRAFGTNDSMPIVLT